MTIVAPQTVLPILRSAAEPTFVCPGEEYPISRAVHLSRLAAYYPKCRECVHRTETGQLSSETIEKLQSTERRVPRRSLFGTEGIRGVYLNEMGRTEAGEIAGALASLLWENDPLIAADGARDADFVTEPVARKGVCPTVVVGQDERPSSIDIVTGVARCLRRMGCRVIDIGLSTRPCFWYAVGQLQATAGIHVTGSGCAPAWTGLDIVGATGSHSHGAIPFSSDFQLRELEARLLAGFSRPSRQAAAQRTFHAAALYESGLAEHFHALRPLRVACGCPNRPVREIIERVFRNLAAKLIPVSIPTRSRNLTDPDDADAQRVGKSVKEAGAHLGLLIDDDGQSCAFFDERGELIPPRALTLVLARVLLDEQPESCIVIEDSAFAETLPRIRIAGGQCHAAGTTLSSASQAMQRHDASLGGGDSGRYWFRTEIATCDAVLTLAKVLQALSRSDTDFSEIVAAAG